MNNILVLYKSDIQSDDILISSFNSNCLLYNIEDQIQEMLLSTIDKSSINQIALIYHNTGNFKIPFYDITYTKYNFFSDELINLFKQFGEGLIVDILTCNLNSKIFIDEVLDIETALNINIRYSLNQTGNSSNSDWILESDNVNVKNIYFTENINNWNGNLYTYTNIGVYGTNKLVKDISGNVIWLHKDISGNNINMPFDSSGNPIKYPLGDIIVWGNRSNGGSYINTTDISENIVAIFSNELSFAALNSNNGIITWGNSSTGGNHLVTGTSGGTISGDVINVYSNISSFAALKSNSSVVTWGNSAYGGNHIVTGTRGGTISGDVISIHSTLAAYAALKSNGSVVTWGNSSEGGNHLSGIYGGNVSSNVVTLFSNHRSFAALKTNGSVVTWGQPAEGAANHLNATYGVHGGTISGDVITIYSNAYTYAALKSDGSVVTWGWYYYGGNHLHGPYYGVHGGDVSGNVVKIFPSYYSYAALKTDGSVVTWGPEEYGGGHTSGSYGVRGGDVSGGVITIYSTQNAFAALKSNGSVVTWGPASYGGNHLHATYGVHGGNISSDVIKIYSSNSAFAALKSNGSVVTWGDVVSGGNHLDATYGLYGGDISGNVVNIYSTYNAFAALKSNGSVVTWGNKTHGGNQFDISYGVYNETLSNSIINIYGNGHAFAAIQRYLFVFDNTQNYIGGYLKMNHYYSNADISFNWYSYSDTSYNNPLLLNNPNNRNYLFVLLDFQNLYIRCIINYGVNIYNSSLIQIQQKYNSQNFDYEIEIYTNGQKQSLFNTASYYYPNNDIQPEYYIDLSTNFLSSLLSLNRSKTIKSNSDVVTNSLETSFTPFGDRLLEIIALKIFGHARARAAISNDVSFRNTQQLSSLVYNTFNNQKNDFGNYYKGIYDINTNQQTQLMNVNSINIIFPFYLSGTLQRPSHIQFFKNGPNVGGTQIINGNYNIPLLLSFK